MSFQVHLRFEYIGLICLALCIQTDKVDICKMLLQFLIVSVVLRLSTCVASIADVTPFMLLSTMKVQFVVSVETLSAEAAFWMPLEARLINSSWIVVTELLMLPQFAKREQLVLVGEDFLMASTEITHHLGMNRFDMTVEIWPSEASNIAVLVGTVVSQK